MASLTGNEATGVIANYNKIVSFEIIVSIIVGFLGSWLVCFVLIPDIEPRFMAFLLLAGLFTTATFWAIMRIG